MLRTVDVVGCGRANTRAIVKACGQGSAAGLAAAVDFPTSVIDGPWIMSFDPGNEGEDNLVERIRSMAGCGPTP